MLIADSSVLGLGIAICYNFIQGDFEIETIEKENKIIIGARYAQRKKEEGHLYVHTYLKLGKKNMKNKEHLKKDYITLFMIDSILLVNALSVENNFLEYSHPLFDFGK